MTNTRVLSISELKDFLEATKSVQFESQSLAETCAWIDQTLRGYRYHRLRKRAKGWVRRYIERVTGYSPGHVNHLVERWLKRGKLVAEAGSRHVFAAFYTPEDARLLALVDRLHGRLSGAATRHILRREYCRFHHTEYRRLAQISASHIYNLRASEPYRTRYGPIHHTRHSGCTLGERRAPTPLGIPGYLRVDTVHQGDDGEKGEGIYHLNLVDEVTQWEVVLAVASLSAADVLPVLELALTLFPFVVREFHADNGSEFINRMVANLLANLRATLSKSRPRRHNDNALVEGKNAWIVRKHFGYHFFPRTHVSLIRHWQEQWLVPYLNFHRPCGFATVTYTESGKEARRYRPDDYQTPYEKLKGLENAAQHLKPGLSFAKLDRLAYTKSDTAWAEDMQEAKAVLAEQLTKLRKEQYLPT